MRILLAVVAALFISHGALAQKMKVGYWTSGFSFGFGAVLEAGKFLEEEGLEVEFIRFADISGPTRALLTQSIDIAYGASTAGAFTLAAEGVPVGLIMVAQVAEAQFVVLDGSPIRSLTELKGKRFGVSPAGSAMNGIAMAILDANYGLKTGDVTVIPGNEGQLAQFLSQKDIDVGALRSVTLMQMQDTKLRSLGSVTDEWKKMTKQDAPPVLGSSFVHMNYAAKNPAAVVKFVTGIRKATTWGGQNAPKVAETLQKAASMKPEDASAYATQWDKIYIASMEPSDVEALRRLAKILRSIDAIKQDVPETVYFTEPYRQSKAAYP
jgi:NitT/TauT family transport system substrate-binding protein